MLTNVTLSSLASASQGTERQIHCLAVHPSRPHLAATGSSTGTVAVWDLRFEAEPTRHALTDAFAGDVWQVSSVLTVIMPWSEAVLCRKKAWREKTLCPSTLQVLCSGFCCSCMPLRACDRDWMQPRRQVSSTS